MGHDQTQDSALEQSNTIVYCSIPASPLPVQPQLCHHASKINMYRYPSSSDAHHPPIDFEACVSVALTLRVLSLPSCHIWKVSWPDPPLRYWHKLACTNVSSQANTECRLPQPVMQSYTQHFGVPCPVCLQSRHTPHPYALRTTPTFALCKPMPGPPSTPCHCSLQRVRSSIMLAPRTLLQCDMCPTHDSSHTQHINHLHPKLYIRYTHNQPACPFSRSSIPFHPNNLSPHPVTPFSSSSPSRGSHPPHPKSLVHLSDQQKYPHQSPSLAFF